MKTLLSSARSTTVPMPTCENSGDQKWLCKTTEMEHRINVRQAERILEHHSSTDSVNRYAAVEGIFPGEFSPQGRYFPKPPLPSILLHDSHRLLWARRMCCLLD